MKKKYIYIALMASLVMVLSSCSKEKDKIPDILPKGPVTLSFTTFFEEDRQAEAYRNIISAFEAGHDNIKVNLYADAVNYDENIEKAVAEGKGPDIIGLQRNRVIEYAEKGDLKDLSSWVEESGLKDKLYGVSLGYGGYKDKYYGVGDLPNTVEWYYNVDMFKKAGLDEPRSLDELIEACKKLKLRGYTQMPIMLGAKDPWVMNTFFGLIAAQTIDMDKFSRAYGSGDKKAFLSIDGADEAVNIMSELVKSGAISARVANYDYASSVDAFVKGKAAILPMGSWGIDKIEEMKPKKFNYKAFDEPVGFSDNPDSRYAATSVQVITVNGKGKHQKEALEFVEFLFSEEAQRIFAEKNGISSVKSVNKEQENPVKNQVLRHLESTDEKSTVLMDNITTKMMNVTGERMFKVINRELDPDDVWELIVNESYAD